MRIESNKLLINNKEIEFEATINKVFEVNNKIIVYLLNGDGNNLGIQQPNNVYLVDAKGNIIWNIKDILSKNGDKSDVLIISMNLNEKNNLLLSDHMGWHYEVDISKREVINEYVSEW